MISYDAFHLRDHLKIEQCMTVLRIRLLMLHLMD